MMMMISTPTSGETRGRLVHDRFTSLDPKNGFDPDSQSRPGADGANGGEDAWHERGSVEGIVPDGQDLALGAEQHLLMRDKSAEPDPMHPDPVNLSAASAG